MHRRLAIFLVATSMFAAGCGTDASAPESVGEGSALEGSARADGNTSSAPDGTDASRDRAEPDPVPAPSGGAETHPSDAYFALDRVMDISIEIAVEDWDTLRHQTRTL